MARRKALVSRLSAVETLGAVYRQASSAALAAIVCCQVGCRSEREPALPPRPAPPPVLGWAIAVELALLLAVVYLPPLQAVFGTAPLPAAAWPGLAACAPAMIVADDLRKRALRGLRRASA